MGNTTRLIHEQGSSFCDHEVRQIIQFVVTVYGTKYMTHEAFLNESPDCKVWSVKNKKENKKSKRILIKINSRVRP